MRIQDGQDHVDCVQELRWFPFRSCPTQPRSRVTFRGRRELYRQHRCSCILSPDRVRKQRARREGRTLTGFWYVTGAAPPLKQVRHRRSGSEPVRDRRRRLCHSEQTVRNVRQNAFPVRSPRGEHDCDSFATTRDGRDARPVATPCANRGGCRLLGVLSLLVSVCTCRCAASPPCRSAPSRSVSRATFLRVRPDAATLHRPRTAPADAFECVQVLPRTMARRPADLDLHRERVGPTSAAPPASSSQPRPPPLARDGNAAAGSAPRKRTAHKPRRAVVRRRGARVDSESDQDELDRPSSPPASHAANRKSRPDSDSDSDLDLPSSDDDDDDEEDADDDGIAEPKTPATASVEQLPQSLDPATAATTPRQSLKSRKAVLAGQVLHPSWSDMPAPGEDGDTSLPTLDFSNLSLDIVQHLPTSPAPRSDPADASIFKAQVPSLAVSQSTLTPGGFSKKQLQEQKRQAKLVALKQKDPEAAERIEAERQLRLSAKRLAKKERAKEKKRERKALELASKPALSDPQAVPSTGSATAALPASNAQAARPPKSVRPVVPSRPSRTAVALGLLGPEARVPAPGHAPSALPSAASATTPVVPAATHQPAFLPRDAEGRPKMPQNVPATRPRPLHPDVDDEHSATQWVRGRGGAPRGFGSYRGRGAARFAQSDRQEVAAAPPPHQDAEGADLTRFEPGAGAVRGRAVRGRGALARGGFAASRGRGVVPGPPGSINPRYAHLPFHPLHRFPSSSSSSAPKSASPVPSNRSTDQASNVEPEEVTTASPDEQLFEAEAGSSADVPQRPAVGVVRLPDGGAAQISIAVKGAAAAAKATALAAREHAASKENRQSNERITVGQNRSEVPKLSDPGILYASEPRRPTEAEEAANLALTASEARREPLSLLHQVPPHLQASAGPSAQQYEAPMYYQQQPYSVPYWSSEPSEPYPISAPSPATASELAFATGLAHPAPSSAYFVPPRPNKRVEIKNPSSRDGQSPAPSSATKSAPPAPVDALEAAREVRDAQILQHQEQQRQAEASYMHTLNYGFRQQQAPASPTLNRAMFAASPTFARDGFPAPANTPLPPMSSGPHPVPHLFPPSPMYSPYPPPPAHVLAPPPPAAPPTTFELVAPYPSHYPAAAAYYAPQQPMYQHSLSPPPGAPTGYYGVYGARPVAYEEQPQWTGY